jgi:DNA-directed RNA polymerase subunit RPC12/RpoP
MLHQFSALVAEALIEHGQNGDVRCYACGHRGFVKPGREGVRMGEWENTRCHHCKATVIRRLGFRVLQNRVGQDGACPQCGKRIPGVWGKSTGRGDGRDRPIA